MDSVWVGGEIRLALSYCIFSPPLDSTDRLRGLRMSLPQEQKVVIRWHPHMSDSVFGRNPVVKSLLEARYQSTVNSCSPHDSNISTADD